MAARTWMMLAGAAALSGCGTYSFGPPEVSLTRGTPDQYGSPMCGVPTTGSAIEPNVEGALELIDNFIGAYRCTLRIAADGRQSWQVPGFLALAGSAAATAFGGGRDWAIAGGAAGSMFNAGNNYYNHADQTAILGDAMDALRCIEMEAVGIEAFAKAPAAVKAGDERIAEETLRNLNAAQEEAVAVRRQVMSARAEVTQAQEMRATPGVPQMQLEAATSRLAMLDVQLATAEAAVSAAWSMRAAAIRETAELGEIELTAERQYFNMVVGALTGVEGVAAKRLSTRTSPYDPAGVVSQIKELREAADEAEGEAEDVAEGGTASAKGLTALVGSSYSGKTSSTIVRNVRLALATLRPKLEKCIVRAQASVGAAVDKPSNKPDDDDDDDG